MAELLQFHVQVYARPAGATPGRPQLLDGCQVTPLVASQAELLSAWPITFDEAAAALAQLPRMFIEPDGSFVWVGDEGDTHWQVDGMLYDRGDRLAYAELKGNCPQSAVLSLLAALSAPSRPLILQAVGAGLLLAEADFLRLAAVG